MDSLVLVSFSLSSKPHNVRSTRLNPWKAAFKKAQLNSQKRAGRTNHVLVLGIIGTATGTGNRFANSLCLLDTDPGQVAGNSWGRGSHRARRSFRGVLSEQCSEHIH